MHEGHRDRLRKTYLAGAGGMHEHQLLELLLTYAIPRKDTNALAHELIARYGSLAAVLEADPHELMQNPGVGEAAAILLNLAGRLGHHKKRGAGPRLNTPAQAEAFCRELLARERYERMYAISLDKGRRVLHCDVVSQGSLAELVVYPRLVVESALRHKACGIILAHNHPSGDCTPSKEDISATKQVLAALSPVGITLQDHIIITAGGAYSMVMGAELSGGAIDELPLKAAEKGE